jgi:hypothetical protein
MPPYMGHHRNVEELLLKPSPLQYLPKSHRAPTWLRSSGNFGMEGARGQ